MLTSRGLPPIFPRISPPPHLQLPPLVEHDPPTATFTNIPRRYVRSSMNCTDNANSTSAAENTTSSQPLRKSSRIHELRSASLPTSSPLEHPYSNGTLSSTQTNMKRYASFGNDAYSGSSVDGHSPTESRSPLLSASSTGSGELSGHVCLCQPEPKVPRPRNAFILYRQHHQHDIVTRHPRLANPEISKIIGEQWQAESDESKRVWHDLAQLEKERHQEQYPNYRYQPRRIEKPGFLQLPPQGHVTVDKYRCPRCGGRSIRNPVSPFASNPTTPTLPPPNPSEGLTPTTRYLPVMSNLSLDSPARRRGPGPSNLSTIQINSSNPRDDYTPSPLTPDSKRRRFNNYPNAAHPNSRREPPPTSYYSQHQRRDSLPPMLMRHSPPSTAGLPPTPSNPSHPQRPQRDLRRSSLDLNLLVPTSPHHHDQSRSVEAMVMSVPYHVKIKVLGRITPPLREAGPMSPVAAIRGAIIAIEGDDLAAVDELTTWLHDFLGASARDFAVKIQEAPSTPDGTHEKGKAVDVGFEDYLDLVREWHGKSRDMIHYITTVPTSSASSSSLTPSSSESSSSSPQPASTSTPSSTSLPPHKPTDPKREKTDPPPLPVLLLPTYQIHAANTYASRIPIQDVYSPMDHWQWMATLWRGTVGPDLTIYVKSPSPAPHASHAGGAAASSADSEGRDVEREREKGRLVEVNEEGRWMSVVCQHGGGEKGKGGGKGVVAAKGKGGFAEAALRRLGFEVGEWVRGVGRTGGGGGGVGDARDD
ncbi:unnamed protein product [Periconia digitata]|uniref:HMG box domain-containing protein n=1 Tax=Periconia digitata TaxID=1303443 RepID=A0A9W4U5G0_9PLEO|nr:unnamed protein product [Periconia digitata]